MPVRNYTATGGGAGPAGRTAPPRWRWPLTVVVQQNQPFVRSGPILNRPGTTRALPPGRSALGILPLVEPDMRTRPAALALALVLLLAACGGDDSTGPQQESILGSYTLVTINGNDFPFLLFNTGVERVEWTGGAITMSENATYSEARSYLTSENGVETAEEEQFTGTYTRIGTDLTISLGRVHVPTQAGGSNHHRAERGTHACVEAVRGPRRSSRFSGQKSRSSPGKCRPLDSADVGWAGLISTGAAAGRGGGGAAGRGAVLRRADPRRRARALPGC